MKNFDEVFPVDSSLIDDGVWFEIGQTNDKKVSRLLIHRIEDKQFQGYRETVRKKNDFAIKHETITNEQILKLAIPGAARYLLRGWENFPPNNPIPYSVEAAEKLMVERNTFYLSVLNMANNTQAYIREELASAKKPLESTSDGKPSGESIG